MTCGVEAGRRPAAASCFCCFSSSLHTVTLCRRVLSPLLSSSSPVSLSPPWGGDGRFPQGKSNNLFTPPSVIPFMFGLTRRDGRRRVTLAIFLPAVRKIVHGRLVGVAMHCRSAGSARRPEKCLDVGWCSSFSSTCV